MSTQAKEKCPLCMETMDLTDKQLKPCKCGYEICLWCWHRIMEMDEKDECGGRCPGCCSIYNKDRILDTSISNQILKEICVNKSNLQKEQTKHKKQESAKNQLRVAKEPIDPNIARVIQRKLVYIIGMPSELARDKVLRQKNFLGQYGKIENIIIDNIGANHEIPDSGRVYVTFSREEEAVRCIEVVNGFILDGRPLKATFGVTRYCHVWLSTKVCRKPNCSYVHQIAPAEDTCTKDDVPLVCARLQHLLGMDMKGPRAGSTLPPPRDCNSKTDISSGNSKDKNPVTLPVSAPRDSSVPSGNSSSTINASLHQKNNGNSRLLPVGPKDRLSEELTYNDIKCQASMQLGNGTSDLKQMTSAEKATVQGSWRKGNGISDSKQMTSAEKGSVDGSWRKPQYVNVVSQGSNGSGRRFTVLTRQLASNDTRSKATGQLDSGISNSKKLTLSKDEHSDKIKLPRCQNVKVVSQRLDEPSQKITNQLSSAIVKSQAGAEEKNASSVISDNPVQGKRVQLSVSTASPSLTVLQSLSGSLTTVSNYSTSDAVSHISVGPDKISDPHGKMASRKQPQLFIQREAIASDTDVATASDCHSTRSNQVLTTDRKHQTLATGGHKLYNREMAAPGDKVSFQHVGSIQLPRPVSVLSPIDTLAKDRSERKRQVCPPGFKELHESSDSGKSISVSSSTSSAPCFTSNALVQDSSSITDQPDIISWVSECLVDDGDSKQSNSLSTSSALSSTDTVWRGTQLAGSCFSGVSNHQLLSPYPGGLLQSMGGVENPMRCCCTFPYVSSTPNQTPEYWNESANSYMAAGRYDVFDQDTMSGLKAGVVGSLLQQSSPQSLHNSWTSGSVDSGLSAQVDLSYPMYTLF